jgi:peptidylprolyl isomerase
MKKVIVCLLIAISGNAAAQKNAIQNGKNLNYMESNMVTKSGVKIEITEKGNGIIPSKGDRLTVHYSGKLTNGTKFDSSYDRNQPFTFMVGEGQVIVGWDEAFAQLHQGDKAILTVPAEAAYGNREVGGIPANSTLIFEVELLNVKPKIKAEPYDVKGKDTLKLASGLEYIVLKKGQGKPATVGTMVTVHYSGYLMDGSLFDSSVERGEPIEFRLGEGRVIEGWEQGIALLHVGSKARFIIPYSLGYGEQGYPPVIPAKATLVFDVELIDVN